MNGNASGGGNGDSFPDHFSSLAEDYSRLRPGYPEAWFRYLASLCTGHELAWDCGTGNGQAAVGLARYFHRVFATDASAAQLAHAAAHPKVQYQCTTETAPHLAAASVDLVTAAQAAHWFDLARFYAEVRRVLKPGGVIALWTYVLPRVNGNVDRLLGHFYRDIVGPYWPPERARVDSGYRDLPFPFPEQTALPLQMQETWDCERYLGYLGTWSAVAKYRERHGMDPVAEIHPALREAWGEPGTEQTVTWEIAARIGRNDD